MLNEIRKKQLRKQLQNLISNNIYVTMTKFLKVYCGVNEKSIINKQITHKDLSILIPNIQKVNLMKTLDNIEAFYTGKFIIVIDSDGEIMAYVTPNLMDNYDIEDSIDIEKESKREKVKKEKIVLDENLSRFELAILCRYYKENQDFSRYRVAHELLKIKKDEQTIEKYKNKKLELRMKGREDDD